MEGFDFLAMFMGNLAGSGGPAPPHGLGLGEVIEFNGPITGSWPMQHVCTFVPSVWTPRLWATQEGITPPARFYWLVPIHDEEADFVRRQGFDAFESVLEERQTDLFEPSRPSAV